MEMCRRLAGGQQVTFDRQTFLCEEATCDRNRALLYYMNDRGVFPSGHQAEETLITYLQMCSVEVNAEKIAAIASTFANGGTSPRTGESVVSPEIVKSALSIMYSCGMYDYSGEWSFK